MKAKADLLKTVKEAALRVSSHLTEMYGFESMRLGKIHVARKRISPTSHIDVIVSPLLFIDHATVRFDIAYTDNDLVALSARAGGGLADIALISCSLLRFCGENREDIAVSGSDTPETISKMLSKYADLGLPAYTMVASNDALLLEKLLSTNEWQNWAQFNEQRCRTVFSLATRLGYSKAEFDQITSDLIKQLKAYGADHAVKLMLGLQGQFLDDSSAPP